ncbi:winged helix-turn-helix transcriptional regulator [Ramlibacter sp. AW1]|uniref:Winged helix-turn-helix transcriptional regulator n=1 Tax=Ramlibacter aurantiacus TaxID=2801330 RepID=A0A936ZMN3_9BURK|nr:MarR family winged helix-turn-helix transcriptional regulator [Ramlibacter aurantiacus]MBL0422983.1 winged helix-turn-helix transcriptional regulator [Ramlibacter aurantiacus]
MTTHEPMPADRLPPDLQDMPGYLIRRAKQKTTNCFEPITAGHKLTPQQYAILEATLLHPDIDQNELGERVALDGSTLGDVVVRLEQRGLLQRRVDGRHRRLTLSAQGQALLEQVQPAVERAQQQILHPLTAREREQLLRLLSKLVGVNNRWYSRGTRRR